MGRIQYKASEGKNFQPRPAGTYTLRITNVEESTSKNEKAMLVIQHEIEDGQYAGHTFKRWFMVEGKGTFRTQALLEAAIPDKFEMVETGEKDDNDNPVYAFDFDTDDLIGATYLADAIIKKDPERGEQNEWRNERPLNAASAADAEEEEEQEEEPEEKPVAKAADKKPVAKEEKKPANPPVRQRERMRA